jgi:hypothetical protein
MVGLEVLGPADSFDLFGSSGFVSWGIRLTVWCLTVGFIASRSVQLLRRVRAAVAQGFSAEHLTKAFEELPEREIRSRVGEREVFLPHGLEAAAFLSAFVLLALGWIFVWDQVRGGFWLPGPEIIWTVTIPAVQLSLVFLPVLMGRVFGWRLVHRWPMTRSLWVRLWQGYLGRRVFSLAGLRAGRKVRPAPLSQRTEVLVAGAAADLFGTLPQGYQDRLDGLPGLVGRLERAAERLRRRDQELERAMSAVGTVELVETEPPEGAQSSFSGHGAVQSHRRRAVDEISSARGVVRGRLADAVAALENLRLGLLRLNAGVGSPDELSADLRVAQTIGAEVDALLDGERQVSEMLRDQGPGLGPAKAEADGNEIESSR